MFEVEIKAHLDDFIRIESHLKQIGAIFYKDTHQEDIYFQHPIRNFAQTDEALRIRISDELNFITYKGAKLDSTTKTREELELPISDPQKAAKIFEKLGFSPVIRVRKSRKIYQLNDITISLDNVTDLGYFVEFELEVTTKEEIPLAKNRLFSLLQSFQIPRDRLERRSYLELLFLKQFTRS